MTFTDTQRFVITFIALLVFLGVGLYTPPPDAYKIQGFIFFIAFGVRFICDEFRWSSPISLLSVLSLFAYGLFFLEKYGRSPYLLSGWQWFIYGLIVMETLLFVRRIRKVPQIG